VWAWLERWRTARRKAAAARRDRREAAALLDALFFQRPEVLAQGRLAPHHRARVNLLEIRRGADGAVIRILLGIVRHPKSHPLQTRGEEVLELLEYRPSEGRLEIVGSRNLTRRPFPGI